MKITETPFLPPLGEQDKERQWREQRDQLQEAGASARRAGVPGSRCPKFVDSDMEVNWLIGWRHEDMARRKRRKR